VPECGTLRDGLRALLTDAVAAFGRGAGGFGNHTEIADLLATVIQTRRGAYRRVLNRAIARHELHSDIDPEFVIDLLIGPLWTRLSITRQPVTDTLVDEVVDVLPRALPPPAPTRATPTCAEATGPADRPHSALRSAPKGRARSARRVGRVRARTAISVETPRIAPSGPAGTCGCSPPVSA